MAATFLAFDLEISRIVPDFNQWRSFRPLGISCAATMDEAGQSRLWYGKLDDGTPASRMTQADAQGLLAYLTAEQDGGRTVVTWNGTAFDFDILGEEAADPQTAARVAMDHADLMFAFVCVQGFRLGLKQAAQACGSSKGAAGIASGEEIPQLWADGQFDRVLAYVEQDVRATADVTHYLLAHHGFRWTTQSGSSKQFSLPRPVKTLHDMTVSQALSWPEPDTSWMTNPPRRQDFLWWTDR